MRLFSLSLFLLIGVSLFAQLPNQDTAAYHQARAGLHLASDPTQIIPLGGLDTLRPALLTIGLENDEVLLNTLNTYVPTARLHWDQDTTYLEATFPHQKPANCLILAVNYDAPEAQAFPWMNLLWEGQRVSIVFSKSEQLLTALGEAKTCTITSKTTSPWAQSLAAQLIFGGIDGQTTDVRPHPHRLGFAPAALLGMDAQLLADSITSILQDGLHHQAFPGVQVMVARQGYVVYHQAVGHHTDAKQYPVQLTDLYDLASISKITTALPALMRLHGQGQFDVNATLQKYYPLAAGTNKANLDFQTMLSHHASLRPWIPYWQGTLRGNGLYPWSKKRDPDRINDYRFRGKTLAKTTSRDYPYYLADGLWQHYSFKQQMVEAILFSPLETERRYRYSGLLFYLLPQIVTNLTGQDYEAHLQQTFYRPLGAYTLGFNPRYNFPLRRIIPTERDNFFRHTLIHGYVHDEGAAMMLGVSANAGLFANAYDLGKMMQMYLNGGSYGGIRFIDEETLQLFTRRHFAEEDNRRGLGFDKPLLIYDEQASSVAEAASDQSFGHSGYTGTFTWADPAQDLLYIFLSNRVYPTRQNRGIYTRNIRPRIHTVLYEAIY